MKEQLRVLAEKVIELESDLDDEGISSGILDDDKAYKIIQTLFPDIKEKTGYWLDWAAIEEKGK